MEMQRVNHRFPISSWLPMAPEEASRRGWDALDIILITGDAYVDHPAFGAAVIGRVLEAEGYRVGIISQPNWRDDLRDFRKLGAPSLFFGVTAGNMDSMVNHYTAARRLRSDDAYTAGGRSGFRPDNASVVYSRILRELFPDVPVVLGGIEASMRRAAHYDYWSDEVKPSVLVDSGADLLLYGMAEQAVREVAAWYRDTGGHWGREGLQQCAFVTVSAEADSLLHGQEVVQLPSFEACRDSKKAYAAAFRLIEKESNSAAPRRLVQAVGDHLLVINPPLPAQETDELDAIYALPYTRLPHPRYKKRGEVPAFRMIRHSVTIHRGCFGGCSFCTISMHQGKQISSRSEVSVLKEVEEVAAMEDFTGVITDLGGPSANMYRMEGADKGQCNTCRRPSCIWPEVCRNLCFDHGPLINLYRKAERVPGVKRVFIGSGIRYDMLTGHPPETDRQYRLTEYTRTLVRKHVSGRLKVAPEHSDPQVLRLIRKPPFSKYLAFRGAFLKEAQAIGSNLQIIPYLIASLPGCDTRAMGNLAADLAPTGYKPEQVQDFTPTPMTLATTIYHTEIHPETGEKVHVVRNDREKAAQRQFLFWYKQENRHAIIAMLKKNDQTELIRKIYRK
jgi:uncharacterized radical SAM protein YgiQ